MPFFKFTNSCQSVFKFSHNLHYQQCCFSIAVSIVMPRIVRISSFFLASLVGRLHGRFFISLITDDIENSTYAYYLEFHFTKKRCLFYY